MYSCIGCKYYNPKYDICNNNNNPKKYNCGLIRNHITGNKKIKTLDKVIKKRYGI